jgi:hypothetical protein
MNFDVAGRQLPWCQSQSSQSSGIRESLAGLVMVTMGFGRHTDLGQFRDKWLSR